LQATLVLVGMLPVITVVLVGIV